MKSPKVLDNKKYRVVDELKAELRKGSKLSVTVRSSLKGFRKRLWT